MWRYTTLLLRGAVPAVPVEVEQYGGVAAADDEQRRAALGSRAASVVGAVDVCLSAARGPVVVQALPVAQEVAVAAVTRQAPGGVVQVVALEVLVVIVVVVAGTGPGAQALKLLCVGGNCLLVLGATWPAQMARVRALVGEMPFLVPGVGAQGGDVEALLGAGQTQDGTGLIINSSRGILYASRGADFAAAARRETLMLRDTINRYRKRG